MLNVLVTGAGSLIGLSILRALKSSSINCRVVCADYFAHAPGLYWADHGMIWPDVLNPTVTREQWEDVVLKAIENHQIDLVLVGLDFEVEAFAQLINKYPFLTKKVVVASTQAAAICKDKYATALFLKEHGFPYAQSALPENYENLIHTCGFPLIVKPRGGFRSRHLYIVKDKDQLSKAIESCPNPVIQQYVGLPENEYTCGTVCVAGQVISAIALRRDLKDGNTIRAYWDHSCKELEGFITTVAEKLGTEGPLNFQLRLTDRGPVIFEINPRFSGTTYMRCLFGLNEIERLIHVKCLGQAVTPVELKEGVVLRYFEDQFISAVDFNKWESV